MMLLLFVSLRFGLRQYILHMYVKPTIKVTVQNFTGIFSINQNVTGRQTYANEENCHIIYALCNSDAR